MPLLLYNAFSIVYRSTFVQFFSNEDKSAVFVFKSNEDDQILYASFDAPEVVDTKFIVFLRVCGSGKITRDNYARNLFYMDWSTNSIEQFEVLTRCIFLPMISIEEKGVVSCDKILDLLHRLMASTQIMAGKDKVSPGVGGVRVEILIVFSFV